MILNRGKINITILLFLIFTAGNYFSGRSQEISAIRAMQLYDAGKFEKAELIFHELLKADPENTMLNYYYGACRTENGHYSDNDLNYLLKAGKQVTPHHMNYYLGLQYHARNEWDQALKYYNQFRVSVPPDEQENLGLAKKIQQCFDKINPFGEYLKEHNTSDESNLQKERVEKIITETDENEIKNTDSQPDVSDKKEMVSEEIPVNMTSVPADSETDKNKSTTASPGRFNLERRELPDLPGVESTINLPDEEPVNFLVNSNITYLYPSHFRTADGKSLFEKIQKLQKELDTTLEESDQLRQNYRRFSNPEERNIIGSKILDLETKSLNIKEEINTLSSACRDIENKYWQNADNTQLNNFIVHLAKIKEAQKRQASGEITEVNRDSIAYPEVVINLKEPGGKAEFPQASTVVSKSSNLVYKIQIGAYRGRLPAYVERLYKKLSLIRNLENYTDEEGVVVYTTGNLTNYDDALRMREQVKQEGIKDPQIVPYFNGKRITLERAKEIESGK
ncbi:MAG: SPOR domain-containing protein [Prolixibacteraceae bacterium]|nr:SPOR domain-containing protein [Prolixibacteraceae bacterium]